MLGQRSQGPALFLGHMNEEALCMPFVKVELMPPWREGQWERGVCASVVRAPFIGLFRIQPDSDISSRLFSCC